MGFTARASAAGFAAVVLLAAAGCGDTDDGDEGGSPAADEGGGSTTVTVDDNVFEPETVEISVGDTVTWEWLGSEPHNVSADDFKSDIQQEGTFEQAFPQAGTYEYVCTVHPGMEGTVEVT